MSPSNPSRSSHFLAAARLALAVGVLGRAGLAAGAGGIIYVDKSAPPGGQGGSWASAYRTLQAGLAAAQSSGAAEVRVAQGTHAPDETEASPAGTGNKMLRFAMRPQVAILGGFAGLQGRNPDARDPLGTPTILTGDLLGNDNGTPGSLSDNSLGILDGAGVGPTAILDGFLITGGYGISASSVGALTVQSGLGPTIRFCRFVRNRAGTGAAIAIGNGAGAGMVVESCLFAENIASNQGGSAVAFTGSPQWRNCIFTGNSAPTFGGFGGGGWVENCVFFANTSTSSGPAVTVDRMRNSIVWGNSSAGSSTQAAQILGLFVEYSIIQNLTTPFGNDDGDPGDGNVDSDPQFIDADGADNIAGTADDDLRINVASPAINAGSPFKFLTAGALDFAGGPRLRQCRLDIGAHEVEGIGADCNGDGLSDLCQIADGSLSDCDGNGIPDVCQFATEGSDCDQSGTLDLCDTTTAVSYTIGPFGPTPNGSNWSTVIESPPPSARDVSAKLTMKAETWSLPVHVLVDGTELFPDGHFAGQLASCPAEPDVALFEIPAELWNEAASDGAISIILYISGTPGGAVPCGGGSHLQLDLHFLAPSVRADCNANLVPDQCDIASGFSQDSNADGVPDECQGIAGVVRVPQDAPTIQAGVDLAGNFFEVILADGVYRGPGNRNIDLGGKALTIRGEHGRDQTVIDLEQTGRAFLIADDETFATTIRDLTIRNGAAPDGKSGGAIRLADGNLTLENVHLKECGFSSVGVATGCHLLVRDSRFTANLGGLGGAIRVDAGGHVEIADSTLLGNRSGLKGGAIYSEGALTVRRCRFLANRATYGAGIAAGADTSALEVEASYFAGQGPTGTSGAGPAVSTEGGVVALRRCTVVGNNTSATTWGTFSLFGSEVRVTSCILVGDPNQIDPPLVFGIAPGIEVEDCLIAGWNGQFPGLRLFSGNPGLVDANGPDNVYGTDDDNPHLSAASICIDRRRDDDGLGTDIDNEPLQAFCAGDIGADETSSFVDCDGSGVSDACELADGTLTDCDADGIPDACESDCDSDGLPDQCDPPADPWTATSPTLPGLSGVTPVTWTALGLPTADGPVLLTLTVKHAFPNGGPLPIQVRLDGLPVGPISFSGSASCTFATTQTKTLFIDPAIFNQAAANGIIQVTLTATFSIPACDQAFEIIEFTYPGLSVLVDCDRNGVRDACQEDCNGNGFPDTCDVSLGLPDCNGNGLLDICELADGTALDCNNNGVPDACDIAGGSAVDCDANGVPDSCDIAAGAFDFNHNGVPDTCEGDCNENGLPDFIDIALFLSPDCDGNQVPDECDIAVGRAADCDDDGVPDDCAVAKGEAADCNANGIPDSCDIDAGTEPDFNRNAIPDACEPDCDDDGVPDFIEILFGSPDANANGIPDECEFSDLTDDGTVDAGDLAILLASWGPCDCPADLDGDGVVGQIDLAILLASWGPSS